MNRNHLILVLVLLSFLFTGEIYHVYADREFGFWGVRSENLSQDLNWTTRTLNIRTGDSVEWVNMDEEDDMVTVVSDNLLWENGTSLYGTGSKFRFTFNSSGIYSFHIEENTRTFLNASNNAKNNSVTTYTYADEDGETHTITINGDYNSPRDLNKAVDTERYPYQRMILRVSGLTIGNGTHPVKVVTDASSNYTYTATRKTISVDARTTPKASVTPTQTEVIKPMESYQEFTLFEVIKRWYHILKGG